MKLNLKNKISYILTFLVSFQFAGTVFLTHYAFDVNALEYDNETYEITCVDTPTKTTFIANNNIDTTITSEYNKITKKVFLDGQEVKYSYTKGNVINNSNINQISPLANNWTPVNVATGFKIDFSPLIDLAGSAASVATKIYMAHLGVTAADILARLVKATLEKHWKEVVNALFNRLLSKLGKISTVVKVIFYYDLQRTSGLVTLNGGSVPVTAYRYANYRATINGYSASSGEVGGWWSSSKPYSITDEIY